MSTAPSKRSVCVLLVVPAVLLLLLATRTWVAGRTSDPVLGRALVSVTGSQAAPGVVALAAVALAAMLAVLTGGPRIRRVSAALLTLAAAGATALTLLVVADPAAALGRKAADQLGRTGTVGADAALTPFAWLAVVCGLALVTAGALSVVAVGRWHGLSSRFERPETAAAPDGGGARRSTWDDLSAGRDPTVGPDADRT